MFFASCIGPVFWTLIPELFSNETRGRAMTAPVLTQWIANAIVVLVFPTVFHHIGQAATFALHGFACLTQGLYATAAVPETKDRLLEDIHLHWSGGDR
jgi:hypothetical protein